MAIRTSLFRVRLTGVLGFTILIKLAAPVTYKSRPPKENNMKKRLFIFVLIAVIAAGTVSAWEPSDLTKYPSCMDDGTWILNLGMGLGIPFSTASGTFYIPPIRLTVDRNTALSDNNLPFFFGGHFGYSAGGYRKIWSVHRIIVGGRFGYHFNWGVDNLDTYAVTSAGVQIHAGKNLGSYYTVNPFDWVFVGANLGVRYFVTDWFGFWGELGFTSSSFVDIGLSFKF